MPKYPALTKEDLRERIKEMEERIKQMSARERSLGELKAWLKKRGLAPVDVLWMYRQMAPQRAPKAVKSKLPLQPMITVNGKKVPAKGDPAFRAAIKEARVKQGLSAADIGKKLGLSAPTVANWEGGRYVPADDVRLKLLKVLGLPTELGAAKASAANGHAAAG